MARKLDFDEVYLDRPPVAEPQRMGTSKFIGHAVARLAPVLLAALWPALCTLELLTRLMVGSARAIRRPACALLAAALAFRTSMWLCFSATRVVLRTATWLVWKNTFRTMGTLACTTVLGALGLPTSMGATLGNMLGCIVEHVLAPLIQTDATANMTSSNDSPEAFARSMGSSWVASSVFSFACVCLSKYLRQRHS